MFKTIEEAVEWITGRRNKNIGFAHYEKLMEEWGNPQDSFKSIHVAGTNGKGSTVNFIADILQAQGYTVGMFTSPHLVVHQDRIRVNKEWIEDAYFLRALNTYESFIEENDLNMFEIDMLIASLYFKDKKVDYAVIETGLGGRLDSTNILHHPVLSVITTIGLDHTERLGDTKEKIAQEKAGIIKKDCPVLIGYMDENCIHEIREKAIQMHSPFYQVKPNKKIDDRTFLYEGEKYTLHSFASYQRNNASVAIEAIHCLKPEVTIPPSCIKEAIEKSTWLGRFETVQTNPLVILDGAHNDEGIQALIQSLSSLPKPLAIVFSALKDKPSKHMATLLQEKSDYFFTTQFDFYRADTAENMNPKGGEIILDYKEAIAYAKNKVGKNGTVLICGSLYFISDVRKELV